MRYLVALLIIGLLSNGYIAENIALYKPAYMSAMWDTDYSNEPGNAVDGNSERNINNGHCAGSNDLRPWWMVDLGRPYMIHNITIVNRDYKKEYLHDFYIELFRVHPLMWTSTEPQQCLFYNGILYDVETLTCDVPTSRRYVRIRKIPRPGQPALMLCEVEIRGTALQKQACHEENVQVQVGKRLQTTSTHTVMSTSMADCVNLCKYNRDCYDVNYQRTTATCEMIVARSISTDVLVNEEEWAFASVH